MNLHHNNNYDGDLLIYITFITALFIIMLLFSVIIYIHKTNIRMVEQIATLTDELNKIKEEQQIKLEEKKEKDGNKDEHIYNPKEQHETKPIPLHEYIMETMSMIEKEMEDKKLYLIQDLNVKQLAEKMNITQKKILEVFKYHPDYSNLNSYINHKRINHACTLLNQHPEYTIEGIAGESGFSSPITFYRWFEKETGMKPKEYREKVLKEKASNT